MKRHILLAAISGLSLAACSEGPDNDQIVEAPPREERTQIAAPQETSAQPVRIDLPEVPPAQAEDQVLSDVIDNTAE